MHTRARTSALATLLLIDGIAGTGATEVSALVGFTLELSSRGRFIDEAIAVAQGLETRLPNARAVLDPLIAEMSGAPIEPVALPPAATAQLAATLRELVDLPSATTLLPTLIVPDATAEDDDDDPLGLDAVMAEVVGRSDPMAGVYDAALQSAERLAGACARCRIHGAGAARGGRGRVRAVERGRADAAAAGALGSARSRGDADPAAARGDRPGDSSADRSRRRGSATACGGRRAGSTRPLRSSSIGW